MGVIPSMNLDKPLHFGQGIQQVSAKLGKQPAVISKYQGPGESFDTKLQAIVATADLNSPNTKVPGLKGDNVYAMA